MDVSKLHGLGWQHKIELEEGIRHNYEQFAEALLSELRVWGYF